MRLPPQVQGHQRAAKVVSSSYVHRVHSTHVCIIVGCQLAPGGLPSRVPPATTQALPPDLSVFMGTFTALQYHHHVAGLLQTVQLRVV